MKIAVVGARGVPATFGGVERHCEEIYSNIAEMGHEVVVYARKGYTDEKIRSYRGMTVVPLAAPQSKHLETFIHSFIASVNASISDADIIHFHAQGPCLFSWVPRVLSPKKKLVFTCHGLDWQRSKWGLTAQKALHFGEFLSAKLFDAHIMVSGFLNEYYRKNYNIAPVTIRNGAKINTVKDAQNITERFGLKKDQYLLFVGRLVPEKSPEKLIAAYKQLKTDKKLVIVGDTASTDDYVKSLKELAADNPNIIFTSYLYNDDLKEIYSNAYCYVSTSDLEGLPLTLLEAMSYGLPCIASDIPPHREVIGRNNAFGYLIKDNSAEGIATTLKEILEIPVEQVKEVGAKGKSKIEYDYDWNVSAKKTLAVYKMLIE